VSPTAQHIEVLVADHFHYRQNVIVPNVWWGWQLRYEADVVVMRPSGYCDEVEIKVTATDIRADTRKRHVHDDSRFIRLWFAVADGLQDHPDIPQRAGVLVAEYKHGQQNHEGRFVLRQHRAARPRTKGIRRVVTPEERMKLYELAAMRIWTLKAALLKKRAAS
jgi:hypothetical protein